MESRRKSQHPEDKTRGPLDPGISLRDLVDKAPAGICVVQTGVIQYANQRLAGILEFERNDLIGMPLENILVSDDVSLVTGNLRKIENQESETIHIEFRGNTRSEKTVYLKIDGGRITYDGKPAVLGMVTDVTAAKEMEAALKESEQRFRFMADNMKDILWLVDFNTRKVQFLSPVIEKYLQYTPQEIMEIAPDKIVAPESLARIMELMPRAVELAVTGRPFEVEPFEMEAIRKDGKHIWFETSYSLNYEDGHIVTAQGVSRDITERKKMEQALQESEIRYQHLIDNVTDTIVEWEQEPLKISYMNPSLAERLYGYSAEEMKNIKPEQVIPPDYLNKLAEFVAQINQALMNNPSYVPPPIETPVIRKDGSIVWVELTFSFTRDEVGNITGGITVNRDITERKKFEQALQDSEKRFHRLADNVTDMIAEWEENPLRATYLSPSAERLYGYSTDELMYINPEQLIPPDYLNKLAEFVARTDQAMKEDPSYVPPLVEAPVIRKDGSIIWVEMTFSFTRDDAGNITGGMTVNRDITKRKQAEEELAKRTAELVRSNAELEQFAYIASHDLQEPLRMVAGFTDLLARRYKGKLDPEADEFINFMVDGATRMKNLINDLLMYSRVETQGKPFSPTDCRIVLENVSANLAVAIQENEATIKSGELPVVMADQTQLTQLFQNLIANAVKFRCQDPPFVDVSVKKQGFEWVFSISDNGIGIDPQHFDSIFAVFQRAPAGKKYPGTGIGLAICKKIAERHGGRIWVTSEPGAGSTFYFTIPV